MIFRLFQTNRLFFFFLISLILFYFLQLKKTRFIGRSLWLLLDFFSLLLLIMCQSDSLWPLYFIIAHWVSFLLLMALIVSPLLIVAQSSIFWTLVAFSGSLWFIVAHCDLLQLKAKFLGF